MDEAAIRNAPTWPEVIGGLTALMRTRIVVSHTAFDRAAFSRACSSTASNTKSSLGWIQRRWFAVPSSNSPDPGTVCRIWPHTLGSSTQHVMRPKTPGAPAKSDLRDRLNFRWPTGRTASPPKRELILTPLNATYNGRGSKHGASCLRRAAAQAGLTEGAERSV